MSKKKKKKKDANGETSSPDSSPVSPKDAEVDIEEESAFTLLPYVDQSDMFNQVDPHSRLDPKALDPKALDLKALDHQPEWDV